MRTHSRSALLALLLLGAVASSPVASAQTISAAGDIELVGQTTWVGDDGRFDLQLDLARVRAPERIDVVIGVHRSVRSRSEFVQAADGRRLGSLVGRETVAPLDQLSTGPSGVSLSLTVPSLDGGVYPVTVALLDRDTQRNLGEFVTFLVRVPNEPVTVPLLVSWVQPLGASPALRPDGSRSLPEDERAAIAEVFGGLREAPSVALDLLVLPETALALERTEDPLLDELRAATDGRELLAATYVAVDTVSLVASGLQEDIAAQLARGDETLRRVLGRNPGSVHSVTGAVTPSAVRWLRAAGVTGLLVPDSALAPPPAAVSRGLTLTRPFAIADDVGNTLRSLAIDEGLRAHFEVDNPALGAHRLLADLAVLYGDLPGSARGVVVQPPDDWKPDASFLALALRGIQSAPSLRPVSADAALGLVEPLKAGREPYVRTPVPGPAAATIDAAAVEAARGAVRSLLELGDPGQDRRERLGELIAVSESSALSRSARADYLSAVDDEVRSVRSRVHVVSGRTFRLTAREGRIPLTVVNENRFPVTVSIEVLAEKLEFTGVADGDLGRRVFTDIELAPDQRTVVVVPVRARTSAAFPLRVVLRSQGGTELGRTNLTVVSTAVSGLGIALSVGAGLFLLIWWTRHWRRSRREPVPPTDAAPAH